MSVALGLSATIHLVAIILIGRILAGELLPSSATVPLVVQIDSRTGSIEPSAAKETQHTARLTNESKNRNVNDLVKPDPEATDAVIDGSTAESSSPVPEIEAERYAGEDAAAARSATRPPDTDNADSENNSNDSAIIHKNVSFEIASTRTKYTERQEKMLGRKVKAWAEELHRASDLTAEVSWKYDGREYVAEFFVRPPNSDMGIDRVTVEISTLVDGNRLLSVLELRRLAFSNFAQFVNRWDPEVQIHDDEVDGRFHANSMIRLAYDHRTKPVFHGKVTTSAHGIDISRVRGTPRRSQIFLGGLETGVRTIRLPRHYLPFPDGVPSAKAEVHHLAGDTRIEFLADGSYTLNDIRTSSTAQRGRISHGVTYFLADKGASVHVRGVVNGKVLVYSPVRIVVEGDLIYEQDPRVVPESDDYLGLVSDGSVDIAKPNVTGPGNLVIHAAIYARRRFAVQSTRSGQRSELHLFGSLSAGTVSATEPRYSTRIQFDQRLTEVRPPAFPLTNRYEVGSWDKHWTMESSH
jgi:hypothetical protein